MGGDRRRSASEMWIDMAPHPLSLILKWMPTGAIVRESLQVAFKGGEARCTFGFAHRREVCRCEVIVRDVSAGDSVRRFGVNDFIVDISGRPGVDGIFRTVLAHGDREVWGDDLMYLLIAQFVESIKDSRITPLATGKIGLRNLELKQQVMQFAFSQKTTLYLSLKISRQTKRWLVAGAEGRLGRRRRHRASERTGRCRREVTSQQRPLRIPEEATAAATPWR